VRQQFKNGKVVFRSSTEVREVSHDLSATADDARKSLEEFRKELLETVNLTTGPWAINPEEPWPDSTVTTMHVYELRGTERHAPLAPKAFGAGALIRQLNDSA
jgi:hypothetical protein